MEYKHKFMLFLLCIGLVAALIAADIQIKDNKEELPENRICNAIGYNTSTDHKYVSGFSSPIIGYLVNVECDGIVKGWYYLEPKREIICHKQGKWGECLEKEKVYYYNLYKSEGTLSNISLIMRIKR